jgi:hypothetical protein
MKIQAMRGATLNTHRTRGEEKNIVSQRRHGSGQGTYNCEVSVVSQSVVGEEETGREDAHLINAILALVA